MNASIQNLFGGSCRSEGSLERGAITTYTLRDLRYRTNATKLSLTSSPCLFSSLPPSFLRSIPLTARRTPSTAPASASSTLPARKLASAGARSSANISINDSAACSIVSVPVRPGTSRPSRYDAMTRFASSDAGSACCASADNAPMHLTRTASSVRASHSAISVCTCASSGTCMRNDKEQHGEFTYD